MQNALNTLSMGENDTNGIYHDLNGYSKRNQLSI